MGDDRMSISFEKKRVPFWDVGKRPVRYRNKLLTPQSSDISFHFSSLLISFDLISCRLIESHLISSHLTSSFRILSHLMLFSAHASSSQLISTVLISSHAI